MRLMITLGYNVYDKFHEWKNNIVVLIENSVSIAQAIEFAETFQAQELLCRLIYDGGKEFYEVLYRCIQKWGEVFLDLALDIIYD